MDKDSKNTKFAYDGKPLPAYRGSEPYIYVCYDNKDSKEVFGEIRRFQDLNHNVYYDETCKSGDANVHYIENCEVFVIFISNNATSSTDVKKQFRRAIGDRKPMLAIYLEEEKQIEMSKGWEYELLDIKGISNESFHGPSYESLVESEIQNLKKPSDEDIAVPSYDDNADSVYVSYAYDDFHLISKEVRRLRRMGCNVSWDIAEETSKIRAAKRFREIEECKLVIVFISNNSSSSDKVVMEVEHAVSENKAILPIYLQNSNEINLSDELRDNLSNLQPIYKCSFDEGEFTSRFSESLQNFGILPKDPTNSRLVPGVGREPLPAYRGENPYIFVSYAHKDSYRVFPEIKKFQDWDYNVWYDEGIAPASEWLEDVVSHIDKCKLFVVFVTKNSVASNNVKKEVKFADHEKKPIVQIFLDEFEELNRTSEWKYLLDEIQGIPKTNMGEEEYIFKCTDTFEKKGFDPYPDDLFEKIELKTPSDLIMQNAYEYTTLYSDINPGSIESYVDDFFNDLELSSDAEGRHFYKDILKSSVDIFLESKYALNALDVYRTFFGIFQIGEENLILDLIEKIGVDDNCIIHSVNVFILGLAFYCQNKKLRDSFEMSVLNSGYGKYRSLSEEFLFRWGIISLLHDIHKPHEKNAEILNRKLYGKFNSILGKDRNIRDLKDLNLIYKSDPNFSFNYDERINLDLFKPTDIMAYKICSDFKDLNFNEVRDNLNGLVKLYNDLGFAEHGLLTALSVLNAYAYMIQEYGSHPDFFYYPILDSATAILLHTYYRYFLMNPPFDLSTMHLYENPLAFLLILCDDILEFYKKDELACSHDLNELSLTSDDNALTIYCLVRGSCYGFGFSNDLSIDELLDVRSMFANVESKIESNLHQDAFKSDAVSRNSMEFLEKAAIAIHKRYNPTDFSELMPQHLMSNVRLASEFPISLASIGYEIAYMSDKREAINKFSTEEINELAIFEHEHWLLEKLSRGWTYGIEKDEDKKISPAIAPWQELDGDFKEKNMDFASNIPSLVGELGFKIVLSKFSLLAVELMKVFNKDDEVSFERMTIFERRFMHKKMELVIESLFQLGYRIVDESQGDGEVEFDKKERKYFAQMYHEEWCDLYANLNWEYGEYYDEELKTHPELVIWQDLTVKSANKRINIFKQLPKLCKETGLAIIKNDWRVKDD